MHAAQDCIHTHLVNQQAALEKKSLFLSTSTDQDFAPDAMPKFDQTCKNYLITTTFFHSQASQAADAFVYLNHIILCRSTGLQPRQSRSKEQTQDIWISAQPPGSVDVCFPN